MQIEIYGDHTTYIIPVKNNCKPVPKTRVLKNGKTIPTWSFMQKLAKAI